MVSNIFFLKTLSDFGFRYAPSPHRDAVWTAVEPLLASLRAKTSELYGRLEPTVGPYVDQAAAGLGRLAANVRVLAAEAALKLRAFSKEVPVGGGASLHDVIFGDEEAQVEPKFHSFTMC